jgi:hypothetical protein
LNAVTQGTGQLPASDPNDPNRKTWTLPTVFSPADEALYFSNQFVMRSRDRGRTWEKISPDLSRSKPPIPSTLDPTTAKDIDQPMTDRFGVVYTISPSPLAGNTVWVGTDDGLIHVTRDDGKTWSDTTPQDLTAWSKISQVEAGHFDLDTAYASVDRHRIADDKPYIYRTHDGGKSWQNVVAGIPEGAYVNCVREDPQAKGLLYAATEFRVYVSFDDGDHWEALQNNMPVTSIRDIVVHGDDLAIATYGRGFWVMDQMSALREIAAKNSEITGANTYLFKPGETFALIAGSMNGTPMPHEEPQQTNPPSGVLVYYWLKSGVSSPLKLELLDGSGVVRACAASDMDVRKVDTEAINVQAVWEESVRPPSITAGTHRFALAPSTRRRRPGAGQEPSTGSCGVLPAPSEVSDDSQPRMRVERLAPGDYTVRLTADGQSFSKSVRIKPDPRLERERQF